MVTLVMNMKEKEEEGATVEDAKKNGVNYGGLMDTPVNYDGSMDTLHETKNGILYLKTTHTEKHVHSVYIIVFRGRHSWRNRNRRMKEGGRRFSIPLY